MSLLEFLRASAQVRTLRARESLALILEWRVFPLAFLSPDPSRVRMAAQAPEFFPQVWAKAVGYRCPCPPQPPT